MTPVRLTENILAAREYSPDVRSTVLRAKHRDPEAVALMAGEMSRLIPEGTQGCVLVPMPSHTGAPTYTRDLAERICSITGHRFTVRTDILLGTFRESQYSTKKEGGLLRGDELGFRGGEMVKTGTLYIIDHVIGTGETARAALDVLPQARLIAYAADLNTETLTRRP